MIAGQEDSRSIDQTASDWAARLDRGVLSAAQDAELKQWLAADPRHKGALLRAQALSLMSESAQALGPDFDPRPFEPTKQRGLSRRHLLGIGGGALAAMAGMAALTVGMPASGAEIRTGRGEMRLVPLDDGSTALLNTDSRIRILYGEKERLISLLDGEVYFSVARDEGRPFIVEVGGRRLRTAQAGFRVRKLAKAPVDILVHQGLVELPAVNPMSGQVVALGGNTHLVMADAATSLFVAERPEPISPERINRELAWRDGKLAFEGETLQQAANAFARYSETRILIPDAALAREPVTGLFTANDPAGFSRAISTIFDARLVQQDHDLILSRTAQSKKN